MGVSRGSSTGRLGAALVFAGAAAATTALGCYVTDSYNGCDYVVINSTRMCGTVSCHDLYSNSVFTMAREAASGRHQSGTNGLPASYCTVQRRKCVDGACVNDFVDDHVVAATQALGADTCTTAGCLADDCFPFE